MKSIREDKKHIRNRIKTNFRSLSPDSFKSMSENVLSNLISLDIWNKTEIILLFLSLPDEIKTDIIIEKAFSEGKKIAVPRIEGEDLLFHFITDVSKDLITHPLGMEEPLKTSRIIQHTLLQREKTLILVPGLAFDKNCFRLGRGKGFYDRFLSSTHFPESQVTHPSFLTNKASLIYPSLTILPAICRLIE